MKTKLRSALDTLVIPVRFRWSTLVVLTACLLGPAAVSGANPITIPVRASDLAYSKLTGLLYAGVRSDARKFANSLLLIDPRTGAIVTSVPVGNDPSKLALSDDSRYLYVVYDRTSIKRFDLSTLRADRSFRVTVASTFDIPDIKVMPGHPDTVAVFLSGFTGIAILDKGVARPKISSDTFSNVLAFSSDTTLWASSTIITPNQVWRYNIDSDGISTAGSRPAFYFSPFDRAIRVNGGSIYGSTGRVYDIGEAGYSGNFSFDIRVQSALTIDGIGNRIYFVTPLADDARVLSFDLTTFRQIGEFKARYFGDIGGQFVTSVMELCAKVGLAFASEEAVTILPFAAIPPLTPYSKPNPVALNNNPRVIPLPSSHITYDAGRRLIYASVPGSAGNIANSVTILDPFQGSVGDSIWVGSEPGTMALSSDGAWLHTGIEAASSIRRIYMPLKHAESRFRLRAEDQGLNPTGFTKAVEIASLPPSPESIVVGLLEVENSIEQGSNGVRVYDNGNQRPLSVPGQFVGGARFLQLSEDGITAYAIDPSEFRRSFITMQISAAGIQVVSEVFGVASCRQLKCQSGLCFTEFGTIIDAHTSSVIGQFPFDFSNINFATPNQVTPDVSNGVVYFIGTNVFNSRISVSSYNLSTRTLIKSFLVPGVSGTARDLIIWGGNQLAFNTPTHIVLMPTALLAAP